MTTSSEWGKLAYRYAQLPAADGVTYGIQNRQFVAVSSGGSGAVTKANFEEYCGSGYFGSKQVGVWYPPVGSYVQVSTFKELGYLAPAETRAYGETLCSFYSSTGAGAGVIGATATATPPRLSTGTTATGSCRLFIEPAVANVSRADISSMYFTFNVDVDAVSTAAQRMTVSCVLTCGDLGDITFSAVDSVNSGNIVITYFNSANSLVTLNTAQGLTAATPKFIEVVGTKSAGTWTLVINLDGVGVLSTTNNQANAASAVASVMGALDSTITKSIGTTARSMAVDGLYSICT